MTTPTTTLDEVVADLEAEHGELDRLVAGLDEAAWNRPTPAEGWAVRDQISHLAFFDDAAVMAIDDPEGFSAMAEAAMSSGEDPMAEHLRQGREMSGAELLEWWRTARAGLLVHVAELDPRARVVWFGPPMSAVSFVSARLMETWAHGQDVADALDVERVGTLRLRHIAHLGVRARPFSYLVRGRELPAGDVFVALDVPGTPGAPVRSGASAERWTWGEEGPDVVRGSAEDFCLVVTQRRNLADTALVVDGPVARDWMAIAQAFAGPPGPGRPPVAVDGR
jgi:uncharacterized protein (TIGR03084 family)